MEQDTQTPPARRDDGETAVAVAAVLDRAAPQVSLADRLAVAWLHGYVDADTRNAYAIDIGLDNRLRTLLPGGPATTAPLPEDAWIPWARAHGINPVGQLSRIALESYAHTLYRLHPRSRPSRQRRYYTLAGFHSWLRREGHVDLAPDDLLTRSDRRRLHLVGTHTTTTVALTPPQVTAMMIAVQLDRTGHRMRNRALHAVLATTACRAQELVDLDLADYQRRAPTGHALLALHGKGDTPLTRKLPARDADLLDAYLAVRIPPPDTGTDLALPGQVSHRAPVEQPLFTTRAGRRLHVDTLTPLLRRLARLPQLDDPRPAVRAAALELAAITNTLHPHQYRHAWAVAANDKGTPARTIRDSLGHASLATTDTYLARGNLERDPTPDVLSALYHAGEVEL